MAVSLAWTAGMSAEEKDSFIRSLSASQEVLMRLVKILTERGATVEKKGLDEDDYNTTDWVFKQAFSNGRIKELSYVVDLLQASSL